MSKLCILVPYGNRIEHNTDHELRRCEFNGIDVRRVPGYSAIDQARNRIIYDALKHGYEEFLWIDSDIDFKYEDVLKIKSRGVDIIGAAYSFKGYPQFTIQPFENQEITFDTENGGIVPVQAVATGFLYTTAHLYRVMQQKLELETCNTSFDAPQIPFYHPNIWTFNEQHYYLGEDFSFCFRARQAGFEVYLDTSIKLGHIGSYTYKWEDVVNPRYIHSEEVIALKYQHPTGSLNGSTINTSGTIINNISNVPKKTS